MPGRSFNASSYRYGFGKQEMDNEISGVGNSYNFTFRGYDPRLGRFKSVDPLVSSYPQYSPYHFAGLNPIYYNDLEGLEPNPYGIFISEKPILSGIVFGLQEISDDAVKFWGPGGSAYKAETWKNTARVFRDLASPMPNLTKTQIANSIVETAKEIPNWDAYDWSKAGTKLTVGIVVGAAGDKGISKMGEGLGLLNKVDDVAKVAGNVDNGVLFSADLTKTKALSRSGHSYAGNKQLHDAMKANPSLRSKIEEISPGAFDRTSTSNGGRRNPFDLEWDHNTQDKFRLDLRTKDDHLNKTISEGASGGGYKRNWKDD